MKILSDYNQYAEEFTQVTLHVDMESLYQPFLAELPESTYILDVGCGSMWKAIAPSISSYVLLKAI